MRRRGLLIPGRTARQSCSSPTSPAPWSGCARCPPAPCGPGLHAPGSAAQIGTATGSPAPRSQSPRYAADGGIISECSPRECPQSGSMSGLAAHIAAQPSPATQRFMQSTAPRSQSTGHESKHTRAGALLRAGWGPGRPRCPVLQAAGGNFTRAPCGRVKTLLAALSVHAPGCSTAISVASPNPSTWRPCKIPARRLPHLRA